MIGVGAPWILGLAVFGALVTVVLHFLSVRKPPVLLLPTMRFLPDRPVRAVSRSARPSDPLLLLLRVCALLLIGVALAGVTWRGTGVKHGRVVVLQRGALEDGARVRQTIAEAMRGGVNGDTATTLVVVDSSAHVLKVAASRDFNVDTVSALSTGALKSAPSLSASILAGVHAAAMLVREVPTVEAVDLVIATPLSRASLDDAVPVARAMWPGALRLADTRAAAVDSALVDSSAAVRAISFAGEKPNDAVTSAFATRGWLATPDASNASNASSTTTPLRSPIAVEWPAGGLPSGWTEAKRDTIGAIVARGAALVFPFTRTSRAPEAMLAQGRAIAWWSDGAVAAIEVPTATSCTRHVGVNVPPASDLLHGQAARPLLLALTAPCGGEVAFAPALDSAQVAAVQGTGARASASAFRSSAVVRTPWAPLLLVLALVLLALEWYLRDREESNARAVAEEPSAIRKVA